MDKNYYELNTRREGAFAYDLKRLYDIFPRNSNVIYQFHDREEEERFQYKSLQIFLFCNRKMV